MASIVQICNMALSHIGAGPLISSIDPPDGSVEADHCATFYDIARTELLEPGNWAFALARATLVAAAANASTAWLYAYDLPVDNLRALRILRPSVGVTVFNEATVSLTQDDRDSATFDIEGAILFTNQAEAVMVYSADVIDPLVFTPSFTSALSFLLAAYLAGPLVKGTEGARLSDAMRSRALSLAEMSATASANASSTETAISSTISAARA